MTAARPEPEPVRVVNENEVAVMICMEPFILRVSHRDRAAPCLICRKMIGGEPATVLGVAALADPGCECGQVSADVFLMHAGHLPVDRDTLSRAIRRGLECGKIH